MDPNDPAGPILFTSHGLSWCFLDDPPPRLHISTVDRRHVIWLETSGVRTWSPQDPTPPEDALLTLKMWVRRHRHLVERTWITKVMIPSGWLRAEYVEGDGDVLVSMYSDTPNWLGVVVPHEDFMTSIEGNQDISVDPITAELVLGARLPDDEQQRLDLAELLWGC
ncbi:MAG: hypothetical protein KF718_02460 [Polyangiaceae bacterium]|nr:hypothetical protein [Polyangiaceae bacterium]